MRRGKASYVLAVLLVICSCSRSDQSSPPDQARDLIAKYGFVGLPDRKRILVRYSTIDEVLKSLGEPAEQQDFTGPGEDFLWSGFTVCTYNDKNLRFYFEGKGRRIIKIDANIPKLRGFSFPLRFSSGSSVDSTMSALQSIHDISTVNRYGTHLVYAFASLPQFLGGVSYRSPDEKWYTVYFGAPWEGYSQ
jgi:hypothetical protein